MKFGGAELKYEGLLSSYQGKAKTVVFEHWSAAPILVREHRSAEERRLQAAMA
ncbi:hypothetical protein [Phyllobacterium bourgognense]|uniref:hypothetical protein n=1 Tax=Phyllobacterium bourgognense TaxID=314236 RepID=UPI0015F0AB57|nr:hypothetical protein [Phyllobacterium bourgognense]